MLNTNYHIQNIMDMWKGHILARHQADWRLWDNHISKIKPKKTRSPRGRRAAADAASAAPLVPSCPEDAVDLSLSFIPKEENDSSPSNSLDLNLAANNSMDIKLALGDLPYISGSEAMSPFSSGGEKFNKWPKCAKTYNAKWENDPILKTWIARHPNDSGKVICRYCHSVIRAHKNDLLEHTRTLKHQRNFQQNTDPEIFNMFVMELNGMRKDTPQQPPPSATSSRKRRSTSNHNSGIKLEFPITSIKSEYPITITTTTAAANSTSTNGHNNNLNGNATTANGSSSSPSPPPTTNGLSCHGSPNGYSIPDSSASVPMEGEDLWQDDDLMSTHLKVILEEPTAADTDNEVPGNHHYNWTPGNPVTQTTKVKSSTNVRVHEQVSLDEEELVSEEEDEFEDEIEEQVSNKIATVNARTESPRRLTLTPSKPNGIAPASDSSTHQNHHSKNQEPMYTAQDVIRSLENGRFNFREMLSLIKAAAVAIENIGPPEEQILPGNCRTNSNSIHNIKTQHGKRGTLRKSPSNSTAYPLQPPTRKRKSTTGSNSFTEDDFQKR